MRPIRALLVGLACAAILAVGYVASPKALPTLELVVPAAATSAEATPTP